LAKPKDRPNREATPVPKPSQKGKGKPKAK
jgi:hypothetical protein